MRQHQQYKQLVNYNNTYEYHNSTRNSVQLIQNAQTKKQLAIISHHHHHHHIRLLEVDICNQKGNMFKGKRDKCDNVTILQYNIVRCSD